MDCDRLCSKWEGIDGWSVYVSIYFLSKFDQHGGSFAAKTLDTFWNERMNINTVVAASRPQRRKIYVT